MEERYIQEHLCAICSLQGTTSKDNSQEIKHYIIEGSRDEVMYTGSMVGVELGSSYDSNF